MTVMPIVSLNTTRMYIIRIKISINLRVLMQVSAEGYLEVCKVINNNNHIFLMSYNDSKKISHGQMVMRNVLFLTHYLLQLLLTFRYVCILFNWHRLFLCGRVYHSKPIFLHRVRLPLLN